MCVNDSTVLLCVGPIKKRHVNNYGVVMDAFYCYLNTRTPIIQHKMCVAFAVAVTIAMDIIVQSLIVGWRPII
jgi:hypothetical protein